MSQIKCPHCAFMNFAISAYCGRCERPLREAMTMQPKPSGAAPPRAPPPRPRPGPPDLRPAAERLGARPRAMTDDATVVQQTPQDNQHTEATVVRSVILDNPVDTEATVVRAYPTPATNKPAVPTPARLPSRDFELGQLLAAPRPPPHIEAAGDTDPSIMQMDLPPYFRLTVAWGVDTLLALAAGGLVLAAEMALFAGHWPGDKLSFLDALATWLSLYPATALHTVALVGLFALVHTTVGALRGTTVGRKLVGLRALRKNGATLGLGRALLRAAFAGVSVLPFFAGYFWVIVDPRRRAWHDVLCNSVVVRQVRHSGAHR